MSLRFNALLVVCCASGCIVPRSMTLGMMAAPVGRGTEVGVFSGVQFASQTNPTVSTTNVAGERVDTQTQNRAFGIPSFEANLQKGFNDHLALNVHASQAGIQPGLKWTVNRSRVAHFAVLPAFGVGYGSFAGSDFVAEPSGRQNETRFQSTTAFTFLGGLKLLFSHVSGFYAGVGYDFIFNRSNSGTAATSTSDRAEIITETATHQLMGALGFSIALGQVSLRPEVAFAVYPTLSITTSTRFGATANPPATLTGGFGWAILPGFSLAVATPKEKAEAEEDERPRGKDDAEDDEEEEETPRRKAPPRKKTDDDDDEDRRKTRRSRDDDSED